MAIYPDYSKAPSTYVLAITEILSTYDEDVLKAICDLKTGIPSRCQFLPTVADITKFVEENVVRQNQFRPAPRHSIHRILPRGPENTGQWHYSVNGKKMYRADIGDIQQVSHPHEAKGETWEVKPQGYWTDPNFDREAYDNKP